MSDTPVLSPLLMDRDIPLGNSEDDIGKRALHVRVSNKNTEPLPITFTSTPTETLQINGSVDTTPAQVPAVAGNDLVSILVKCKTTQTNTNVLYFSFDGTNYNELQVGEWISWDMGAGIKQIYLKGSVASVDYEFIYNVTL